MSGRHFLTFLFIVLGASSLAAEHVAVVAPAAFHRSLEPWIKYRTEQGWTVHVIVEPFGTETATTPQRVRERIRLLAEQVPLSALLLVGNGSPRNNADGNRVIPSPRILCRLIQHFGDEKLLATDNWYGDLDDDGLPDIAVGRFAVETTEQLDAMIRKTIRFETETPSTHRRRFQVVAGVGNFSPMIDAAIESTAKYVLSESVPAAWDVALLHLNWKSPFCPDPLNLRREIIETLGAGALFWAYIGHGQHRMLDSLQTPLGDFPTLSADDLDGIHSPNGASIALLFCCYGGVPDATTSSLAEEMHRLADGPVAVYAASRTTMPYGMAVLGIELLREAVAEPTTLGALILAAERRVVLGDPPPSPGAQPPALLRQGPRQRSIRASVGTLARLLDPMPNRLDEQLLEHVALFHLFGDPLLRLPTPKQIELDCPKSVQAGSTLNVSGTADGTVLVELVPPANRLSLNVPERTEYRFDATTRAAYQEKYRRSNDRALASATVPIEGGVFHTEIPIPDAIHGEHVIRVCRTDGFALGAATVTVQRTR